MRKVFVIGGTTFDHIVHLPALPQPQPQTIHQAVFHEGTGSTGAGKALNLHRLQVPVQLYSVLGNDSYGDSIRVSLQEAGVDAFYDVDPHGTERHVNLMDPEGNRISIFITQSSETIEYSNKEIEVAIAKSDVLVLNIISYCRGLIPLVTASGKPVWTDLHDYDGSNVYHQDFINASQYIHLSSDNLTGYRNVMEDFIQKGKQLVVCTHGRLGATALTAAGEWFEQPALTQFPYVDGNGAGDAFFSGFIYGWLQNLPVQKCMQLGTVTAALCIGSEQLAHPGLTPDLLKAEWGKYYS